jgi:hypothetical protein
MGKLIFENISVEDAEILAKWYEGQGEQDADVWFEVKGKRAPLVDIRRKNGCIEIDEEKQEVKLYLK